jgi:SAM-dependent methyltransferase
VSDLRATREAIEQALDPPAPPSLGGLRGAIRRLALRLGQPRAAHQQQIDRQLLASVRELTAGVEELRRSVGNTNVRLHGVEAGGEQLRSWNHDLAGRIDELAGRIDPLREQLRPIDAFVSASRSVPDYAALGLEHFALAPAGNVIGYRGDGRGVAPGEEYVAFEDVFRLSEDVIRERQRPYVGLLGSRQPVLDVGCGRGEFLELLRADGITARGVDLDAGMVARARAKGLDVDEGDGVAHLDGLPDGSLGAVFAAQVVEHLPYERLVAFLRLAHQKLQPGGILIAETVNPHSPGALKNFWLDPTHQHPVFPEVLLTLCRGIGFDSAYVFHPGASGDVDADREQAGDYTLVAER